MQAADHAYDPDGEAFEVTSLRNFAVERWCGSTVRRAPPNQPDEPHHWVLLEDVGRLGRVRKLADRSAAIAWAHQWRESHRELRGRELVAYVAPGKKVAFAIWAPTPLLETETRTLAWELSGDVAEPRFRAVTYPYDVPDVPADWGDADDVRDGIYLAPDVAAPSRSLRDRRTTDVTISGRPTGIAALDGILSGGYLPSDALVAIGGNYGQGKSTTLLEVLENLSTDPGTFNVYLVLDEPELPIRARRLQRRGLSREEARAALNTPTEEVIGDSIVVVTGLPGELFEDFLVQVLEEAAGRRVNLVIDSIQKLNTRAGVGKGAREKVGAASNALRAAVLAGCGKLRILFSSEVARGTGELKDSGSLDFDADLILLVGMNASEDALSFEVSKNRYGPKRTLTVGLDLAGQRLFDPADRTSKPRSQRKPPEPVWPQVVKVLTERGPLSGRGLEMWVKAKAARLRAELEARTAAGDVQYDGNVYRLPE